MDFESVERNEITGTTLRQIPQILISLLYLPRSWRAPALWWRVLRGALPLCYGWPNSHLKPFRNIPSVWPFSLVPGTVCDPLCCTKICESRYYTPLPSELGMWMAATTFLKGVAFKFTLLKSHIHLHQLSILQLKLAFCSLFSSQIHYCLMKWKIVQI